MRVGLEFGSGSDTARAATSVAGSVFKAELKWEG